MAIGESAQSAGMGTGSSPEMSRITPQRIVSWGLDDEEPYKARSAE